MRIFKHLCLIGTLVIAAGCSTGSLRPASLPPSTQPAPPATGTVVEDQGIIAGAHVGGGIARSLNRDDQDRLEAATQKALETGVSGHAVKWRNSATGSYGSVTPQPRFMMDARTCREFQQDIYAGGEMATGYGTACRDRRGIWRIAENG